MVGDGVGEAVAYGQGTGEGGRECKRRHMGAVCGLRCEVIRECTSSAWCQALAGAPSAPALPSPRPPSPVYDNAPIAYLSTVSCRTREYRAATSAVAAWICTLRAWVSSTSVAAPAW